MEGFGSAQGVGVSHINLGWVKIDAALYESALSHFALAASHLAETESEHYLTTLVGLGEARARMGDLEGAESSMRQVIVALGGRVVADDDAKRSIERMNRFAEAEGLTTLWSLTRQLAASRKAARVL
jgi:hypothetical protein